MKLDLAHDVFGRTRYAANKEDMGGVGSFDSDTKTIYVGGIPADHDIEVCVILSCVCVCVCVCARRKRGRRKESDRERERERERLTVALMRNLVLGCVMA